MRVHHIGTAGPPEQAADSCRVGMLKRVRIHGSEEPDEPDLLRRASQDLCHDWSARSKRLPSCDGLIYDRRDLGLTAVYGDQRSRVEDHLLKSRITY